jgi:hypothetical protein
MARKLEIYGFNEKAFAVFNSYMTNRTQQVQIGNALSNKCPVNHGVLKLNTWSIIVYFKYK